MSSNINNIAANIDATYPVAGQDNSSQGFRDNFSFIKQAFSTATNEISDLQTRGTFVDQTNDFQFAGGLLRVKLQNSGFVANNNAATSGSIDYASGSYQKTDLTTQNTSTTITVSNWPTTGIYAPLRLEVKLLPNQGISFNNGVSIDGLTFPHVTSISSTSTSFWDVWTSNGGTNIYVQKLGSV